MIGNKELAERMALLQLIEDGYSLQEIEDAAKNENSNLARLFKELTERFEKLKLDPTAH